MDLINGDKADDPFKIMELTKHVCKTTCTDRVDHAFAFIPALILDIAYDG